MSVCQTYRGVRSGFEDKPGGLVSLVGSCRRGIWVLGLVVLSVAKLSLQLVSSAIVWICSVNIPAKT